MRRECRQIVGLARSNNVVVSHYFRVFPARARVHYVVFDREKRSCALAAKHPSRTQDPGSVADGGHQFSPAVHLAHKIDGFRMPANKIGGESSWRDNAIEVFGARRVIGNIGFAGITQLAGCVLRLLRRPLPPRLRLFTEGAAADTTLPVPHTSDRPELLCVCL